MGTCNFVVRATKLGTVGATEFVSCDSVTRSALSEDFYYLPILISALVDDERKNVGYGLCQLDKCYVIGGRKYDPEKRPIPGSQCLIKQFLRRLLVSWMYFNTLDRSHYTVNRYLFDFGLPRNRMSGGNNPLRSNQYSMSFAWQIHQSRKFGCRDSILRVINVSSNDDRICIERYNEQC